MNHEKNSSTEGMEGVPRSADVVQEVGGAAKSLAAEGGAHEKSASNPQVDASWHQITEWINNLSLKSALARQDHLQYEIAKRDQDITRLQEENSMLKEQVKWYEKKFKELYAENERLTAEAAQANQTAEPAADETS